MKHVFSLFTFALMSIVFSIAYGQESCPNVFDFNDNNTIDIEDFLGLLGLFADDDTDGDGIWDSQDACIDLEACNYAAIPSEPCAFIDVLGDCGGGCEGDGDGDGICDDVDMCVGELDVCGVCNGPGPTEVVIEDIVITYDSVFLPVDDEWYVYAVEVDTTFGYTCAPFFDECGDPMSYQGYDYATVLIGEQCWFAENLRSESYENGDVIHSNLSNGVWVNMASGAVSVYNEDASFLETYGRLYNWHAVDDARGLCPSGWHVPTNGEWTVLIDHLGGWSVAGVLMKANYGWNSGGNGTNSSGFSGLPGGRRDFDGYFNGVGSYGIWWTSTQVGDYAYSRHLFISDNVNIQGSFPQNGFSVRCVRDAE